MPSFKLISADGHLNDPPAAWERAQKEYGERAPRVVENPPGLKGLWLFADQSQTFAVLKSVRRIFGGQTRRRLRHASRSGGG